MERRDLEMNKKVIATPYDNITYKIIGCAMALHREFGPGLRENTYQRSLANHFADKSITFKKVKLYPMYDDSEQERLVGYCIPDFVVEEKVIVEIKAVKILDNDHLSQITVI